MAYLILLVSVATLGAIGVWLFERAKRRPQSLETSITDFERRMQALGRPREGLDPASPPDGEPPEDPKALEDVAGDD